jgi:hypothetical protein
MTEINKDSQFSIRGFSAAVRKMGMARPTHFEVEITEPLSLYAGKGPVTRTVNLFCKSASLPQTRINTSRLQIAGRPPSYFPISADYGGDNITLSFYVDQNMDVKAFFDEWIDNVIARENGEVQYANSYYSQMTVKQLNANHRVVYAVKFEDIFPVAINPLMLDHNSTGQVHELSVTFNYRRWDYDTIDYNDPVESSTSKNSANTVPPKTDQNQGNPSQNSNPQKNRSINNKNYWKSES